MSHLLMKIHRLKSEVAAVRTEMSILEFDLFRNRETIRTLLGQDVQYTQENARLKKALSDAHRHIRWDCECEICQEVDHSRMEVSWL
jgi:hypothetical protein